MMYHKGATAARRALVVDEVITERRQSRRRARFASSHLTTSFGASGAVAHRRHTISTGAQHGKSSLIGHLLDFTYSPFDPSFGCRLKEEFEIEDDLRNSLHSLRRPSRSSQWGVTVTRESGRPAESRAPRSKPKYRPTPPVNFLTAFHLFLNPFRCTVPFNFKPPGNFKVPISLCGAHRDGRTGH